MWSNNNCVGSKIPDGSKTTPIAENSSIPRRANSHENQSVTIEKLWQFMLQTMKSDEEEDQKTFLAIPYEMHAFLTPKDESQLISKINDTILEQRAGAPHKMLMFFNAWLAKGRPLSFDDLCDIKKSINNIHSDSTLKKIVVAQIQQALEEKKALMAKRVDQEGLSDQRPNNKSANVEDEDLRAWLEWDVSAISNALTESCIAFQRLRACELADEKDLGPNARTLNSRSVSLSHFVALSILAVGVFSIKDAKKIIGKWLDVADDLLLRHNYHMLHAIQMGLSKHQVERIKYLFDHLSKKRKEQKAQLDALFNPDDHMSLYIQSLKEHAGKSAMIPSVYWLLHKATLLQQTPHLDQGRMNKQKILAAGNIFDEVVRIQTISYKLKKAPQHILQFFERLESKKEMISEEDLYSLSDFLYQLDVPLRSKSPKTISWREAKLKAGFLTKARKAASMPIIDGEASLIPKKKNLSDPSSIDTTHSSDK